MRDRIRRAKRKSARLLALGHRDVPSSSTVQSILRRHGHTADSADVHHQPYVRFERDAPNSLWQMDFKGHFPTSSGRCHPLTVLDDHSRFSVVLHACANERGNTVQTHLTAAFRRYGMPERILSDNGPPWGVDGGHSYTPLVVWLIRLGITPLHGRPYHPQTQGKEERFHRTLHVEVLRNRIFRDLEHVQSHFEAWRDVYNLERPTRRSTSRPRRRGTFRVATLPGSAAVESNTTRPIRSESRDPRWGRIRFAGRNRRSETIRRPSARRSPDPQRRPPRRLLCPLKLRELDLRAAADEAA